jgi:hypothetical protein
MSKISGFSIGNPDESFVIYAGALGGNDVPVMFAQESANPQREQLDQYERVINSFLAEVIKPINKLKMLSEMFSIDPETESITLDKTFVDDYNESVSGIEQVLNKLKEFK